jgi:hypothetical protein
VAVQPVVADSCCLHNPADGRPAAPWLSDGARGTVVGVVASAVWYLTGRYAESATEVPLGDTPIAALGATAPTALTVAVPACLACTMVTGWALRLHRPWLVAGFGLLMQFLLLRRLHRGGWQRDVAASPCYDSGIRGSCNGGRTEQRGMPSLLACPGPEFLGG